MKKFKNILIIGAGIAGDLLRKDIEKKHPNLKVIGFVDDNKPEDKSLKYLGKIKELSKINKIYKIDEMVIAIPSADGELVRTIILNNLKNKAPIRIVPRDQKVISYDDVKYEEIEELKTEDFLGRPFIKDNVQDLKNFYKGKTVLITGGAGSIGSEIVRQLLSLEIKKVIVYDNSEYLNFNLDQNLKEREISQEKYRLIIGNILNYSKLDFIVKEEKPDLIFHAAAYKHVYLMEDNIDESVRNNVIGTKNVVDIASKNEVEHFVFISTDKVVNPTSVMGATKKLGEYYIKSLEDNGNKTKFTVVRFGNVINSNGSVLPLFERQIKENNYVTVTHKEIKRFFMSIREASQLVIASAASDTKGNIFILNMGELINIYEVAQCLIRSKNLISHKDVDIKIIGLKKGEKLIEELFTNVEKGNLLETEIKDVFRLKNFEVCPIKINEVISSFKDMLEFYPNEEKIKKYIKKIFSTLKNNI